jgi:hypothetical protein
MKKGTYHTQEAKLKQSLAHKGMHINPQTEFKKGLIPWNKGLAKSIDSRLMAIGNRNKIRNIWNRGLTAKDDERIKRSTEAAHKACSGKPSWNKDKPWSETSKNKMSQKKKDSWRNPLYAKKQSITIGRKPNQDELYVDAILQLDFPNEWKYVGDGKFWIEGKNPDFVNVNGKKIVIEYNGFRAIDRTGKIFGHTEEKDQAKTYHYAKYGFKTINLYRKDLNNLEEILKNKFILR